MTLKFIKGWLYKEIKMSLIYFSFQVSDKKGTSTLDGRANIT